MIAGTMQATKPQFSTIFRQGLLAAVVAALVNAIIFVVGSVLEAFPPDVIIPQAGQPMTIFPVLFTSVVGALVGTLVYALLVRFTGRPNRIFQTVALVVLVASFASPFTVPDAPPLFYTLLLVMHIVVAAATVFMLTRN
jgi:hypothetical protein